MDLTRRYFLQSTGALTAYLGVAPNPLLAMAPLPGAVEVTRGKTLVVIFLRGGADGLNLVVPYGDEAYSKLRGSIAIQPPGGSEGEPGFEDRALDLDGYYGLHPRLEPLVKHFDSGLVVAAHAVGYDENTRSHFEEQDVWETGITGNTISSDGWLNRHLATSTGHGRLRAVAIGDTLPRILRGKAAAYAVRGVEDLTMPDVPGVAPGAIGAALEHAYCTDPAHHRGAARDLLAVNAASTLDGMKQLEAITRAEYDAAVEYPQTPLGGRMKQVARLIKADVGLEVAEVDFGGWDTHQGQGGANGMFANLAGQLAGALDAFARDLEDRMDDVVVVTLTDFGRTAAENGTGGTAAGAERKVLADWPGLVPDQLHEQRDLLHTTDFRDVLAELVRVHLGNPSLETVLPGHRFKPVGLIT
jgi:uncharacterized protein (DUF1501 family)